MNDDFCLLLLVLYTLQGPAAAVHGVHGGSGGLPHGVQVGGSHVRIFEQADLKRLTLLKSSTAFQTDGCEHRNCI